MEKSADQRGNNFDEMTPKNIDDPVESNAGATTANVDDSDLQEVAAVNASLDELTQALDFFEQRTDDIISQLKVLLDSNREIRQQIAQDKELDMTAALAAANISSGGNNKKASGDADEQVAESSNDIEE